jgi:maltose O-acetyltransferase
VKHRRARCLCSQDLATPGAASERTVTPLSHGFADRKTAARRCNLIALKRFGTIKGEAKQAAAHYLLERLDRHRQIALHESMASIGIDSSVKPTVIIYDPHRLSLGNRTAIADGTIIWASGGVTIGDDVLISANCTITSATHPMDIADRATGQLTLKPVRILDNAWLGAGAIILPGVTVGMGAIVGAGAVVTRDVPDGTVVTGIPAR